MDQGIKTVFILLCIIGTLQVSYGETNTGPETVSESGQVLNVPPSIVAINLDNVILDTLKNISTQVTIQVEDLNGVDTLDYVNYRIVDPYNNILVEKDSLILNSSETSAYYIGNFELESNAPIGIYKIIVTAQDLDDSFNVSEKSFVVTSTSFMEFSDSQTGNILSDENSNTYFTSQSEYNMYNQFYIMSQEITQINQNILSIQKKVTSIYIIFFLTLLNSIFSISTKIKAKVKMIYQSKK